MSTPYNMYYSFPPFFFNLAPIQPQIHYQSEFYSPVLLNSYQVSPAPPTTTSSPPSNSDLGAIREPERQV